MRRSYPLDRRQTYFFKHVEPMLKTLAICIIAGFAAFIGLSSAGVI